MSKRDRKLVQEAEAQLIAFNNQLISNLFYGLCDKSSNHPNFTDPDYRWGRDGFAVLKNENEETPKLLTNCPVSIYSQNAFELSVALHFITQDAVEKLLKTVTRYLTRHNLNPSVAMGALMNQMILQGNSRPLNSPII
jgi:hypothetical protein